MSREAVYFSAIIGLLMAILMPALNLARDQGRRASCMSNMRQVGLALTLYQNEYEKTPPKTHAVYDYATPAAPDNVLKLPGSQAESKSGLCSLPRKLHGLPGQLCRNGPGGSVDSQPRQNHRHTGRLGTFQPSLGPART